jgi:hypothetical protein
MQSIVSYQVITLDANRDLREMEEEFHKCEPKILLQQQIKKQEDSVDSSVFFVGGHSI